MAAASLPPRLERSGFTPGIEPETSAEEKFIRPITPAVLSHVSPLLEYPVGSSLPYRGSPRSDTFCTSANVSFASALKARAALTTISRGDLILDCHAPSEKNSGDVNMV